jgi:tetratricopeptide (TPR) repeat protein
LDQDPTVPRLDEGDPLPALQTYLGPRVYRWLCACAVYPELHWDLTLHFGGLSIFGPGLISEENLLRLLRLPWFRQGAIPDEIRARLIDQLTEAEERAVREAIVELLERNPAPGDSVSANRYELDLVVQRLALHRRDPKQRRAAMRDLAGFPRRELVQDFAMLKLIEEMPSSRLQVLLPRRLRRVFYRGGVPVLGVRSGIRAAALAGVIGASLFFTRRGTVESQQDMVIFLQGTYGSPTLVVGEQTNVLAFRRLPDSVARNGFNLSTFPDEFTDWSVDRPDILTVDRLGEVVALKPGEAVVTVFSAGHQSRLRVRVEPAELAINRDSVELSPGDVRALKLLVPSQDRELISRGHEGVSWSVSDSTLVRVAPDGVIEALRPGRATVTVNAIRRRARVAVTIGGEPVNQPRIAGDARRAIDQVVQEYTRAAAAGDIDRMVSLYPSLPKVVRAGYDRLGAARGGIRTKDWKIESAAISQDSARLKMSGSLDLFDDRREVIWQADLEGITLARRDDRWLITGIQTVRQSKNLPPEALAYFSRARMFYEQGNRDRARLFAERALAAYPVYTEAESLLEQLNSGGETTWTEAGSTALTRLDSLRLRAVTGRRTARKEYFAAFDSVLLRPTQDLIRRQLLALPSRPEAGADYVRSYNLLKAHLITTGFPLQSSPDFLAPVLTQVWGEAAHPSAYLLRLAATQFAFYAGELPQDKSLVFGASDTLAIQRARSFLRQFNGGEQVYSMMLSEAARSGAQPFAFPRLFPSAGQVLVVPHVVPAGFTRQGWAYMEGTVFKHSDRYFQGVDGVLGGEGPDEREHQDLLNSIRSRYRRDYEEQWRQVLAQTRLVPYANLADASRKLRILAGNPSPLLQLINAVSLNTAMDSGFASTVFQPARVVSPADSTRLTGPLTGPYLKAIAGLGTALEALVAAEPEARKGPGDEAKAQLVAAKTAAQALQLSFTAVPGGVGSDINRLLTSVFGSLDSTPGQIGTPGADRGQTPEAASVVLGAGVNSLQVGQTVTLVALARDAKGKALADRTLVWKSRNPLVASVTADGKVTALVDGTAEIVVEVDGISASQRVTVTPGGQDSTARITVGDSNVSGRARNIPPEALSAYSRALLYQDQDSLQKASDYFRDALRIYPDYREAHEGLTRVVVRERLNDWTKHLEGRSLAGLLQLYPDMPQKDQLAWKRLLENPSVTRIAAVPQGVSVELTGQVEARVRYTLAYSMTVRPSGVQTSVSRYEATFKLVRGAWIITSMQGQP